MRRLTGRGSRWLARFAFLGAAVMGSAAMSGCAVHDSSRQFAPGAGEGRIAGLKSFHVRNDSAEKGGLAADIVGELKAMGYRASTGAGRSPGVDAMITFNDQWTWDITMYMISLEIQLREPGSDAVFATAKTVRTSLVRKSQKEMVEETLTKLLTNP